MKAKKSWTNYQIYHCLTINNLLIDLFLEKLRDSENGQISQLHGY